jgi:hypothetical protein
MKGKCKDCNWEYESNENNVKAVVEKHKEKYKHRVDIIETQENKS